MASAATSMDIDTTSQTTTEKPPTVQLKKWHGVALWMYDIPVENCAICHNNIMELCINCQADSTGVENVKCEVEWGRCNHVFHNHCIARWVRTRPHCPLDQSLWETQRIGN